MKAIFTLVVLFASISTSIGQIETSMTPSQQTININMPISAELKPNGDVRGTPLLSEKWMKAAITTWDDKKTPPDDFLYNFNLINNELLAATSKGSIYTTVRKAIKTFTLTDGVKEYRFERPKVIDYPSDMFVQVIYQSAVTTVYKGMKKELKHSSSSEGMMQTSDPYQEYEETDEYFIYQPNKTPVKTKRFNLKTLEGFFPAVKAKAFKDFAAKNKFGNKLSDEDITKAVVFLETPQ